MSHSNRELVKFYVRYKLAKRNYSTSLLEIEEPSQAEALDGPTHSNGAVGQDVPAGRGQSDRLQAVKEALRASADEFELCYQRAFSDLSSQLHITPATAYQSFESVMNEVFRDGVNWGRVVGLFVFGGALCVECIEKEMSSLVVHIIEWMTVYLDTYIQPWIQDQGGWERFAEIFGNDAAAQSRRSVETLKSLAFVGLLLAVGVLLISFVAKKR